MSGSVCFGCVYCVYPYFLFRICGPVGGSAYCVFGIRIPYCGPVGGSAYSVFRIRIPCWTRERVCVLRIPYPYSVLDP